MRRRPSPSDQLTLFDAGPAAHTLGPEVDAPGARLVVPAGPLHEATRLFPPGSVITVTHHATQPQQHQPPTPPEVVRVVVPDKPLHRATPVLTPPPLPRPVARCNADGKFVVDSGRLDQVVFDSMTWLDGSMRRWAHRRATGQSDRDIRGAIVSEMFDVRFSTDLMRPSYNVGGFRVQPYLAVRSEVGGPFVYDMELDEIAWRARRLLSIPSRTDDTEAPLWAVRAKTTGVIAYCCEGATPSDFVDLLEPSDVGNEYRVIQPIKPSQVMWWDEIRRPVATCNNPS